MDYWKSKSYKRFPGHKSSFFYKYRPTAKFVWGRSSPNWEISHSDLKFTMGCFPTFDNKKSTAYAVPYRPWEIILSKGIVVSGFDPVFKKWRNRIMFSSWWWRRRINCLSFNKRLPTGHRCCWLSRRKRMNSNRIRYHAHLLHRKKLRLFEFFQQWAHFTHCIPHMKKQYQFGRQLL